MARLDETRTCDAPPALAAIAETRAGDEGPAAGAGATPRPLARGRSVGRYVILDRIGHGGMGVVYAAYDPELDRKVALKLLHDVSDGPVGRRRSQRLVREAQAMAQLSHPNVITVYDVGTFDGRVFFAMELVEGHTLAEWLQLEPRAWPEIVEAFIAAGRGLHAAHVAGLVHRDFKPDNVLVGTDGRVRVTDFGIARPPRTGSDSRPGGGSDDAGEAPTKLVSRAEVASPPSQPSLVASPSGRVLDLTLTRPGVLPGTPAYMSPEQFGEGALDARGDQFSFCVALWEALYGDAPFSGTTAAERALAISVGVLRPPPAGSGVPAFVHAALVRGLSVEPDARYPDMAALLTVLGQRPLRRRRWWLLAGGLAALMGATAAGVALRPDPCASAGREMASTWGDEARASVEAAMLGTGLPYAQDTWSRIRGRLDAHADAWVVSRVDACRAVQAGGITEAQLDRRERCLERQRARLDAVVGVLAQADRGTVERASGIVAGLPRAEECADPQALLDVPAEPETPERVELRERLLHGQMLQEAGRYKDAQPLAEVLVRDAEAHGDPALLVDALALDAMLLTRLDPVRGEAALRRAYFAAVRHHQDGVAARMATVLVFLTGYAQARADAGLEWGAHADATIDRAGGQPRTRIRLLKHTGDVLARKGDLEGARRQYDLVEAQIAELEAQGERAELVAHDRLFVATGAAAVKLDLGRDEEALGELERALALAEELLGPRHPEVGRVRNELGNVAMQRGRLDDAREHYEVALELWTAAEGEQAPSLIPTLTNLGNVADLQGRLDEAQRYYERALAVAEARYGRDHVDVAFVLVNLGMLHEHAGKPELARQQYARALELRERALGPEHAALANPLFGLSRVELELGQAAAAASHAERALVVRRAVGGKDETSTVPPLVLLGRAQLGLGHVEQGRARLEQALALCEAHACDPEWTGMASLSLWTSLGPEAAERRAALLERARADLERSGAQGTRAREELRRVLAELEPAGAEER